MAFSPRFSITPSIASNLLDIERFRGFIQGATLSETWIKKMQQRARE